MNLVTINPYRKEHQDLMNNNNLFSVFQKTFQQIVNIDEETWNIKKQQSNDIQECMVLENNGTIDNYCMYTGTKDNRMVQMEIGNMNQKSFIESAMNYAFETFNAHTVTILSYDRNQSLSKLGFECLGDYQGKTMYLKEKSLEKTERVKV